MSSLTNKELYNEGITKLKEIAKNEGVKGYSRYRSSDKKELVDLIIKNRKAVQRPLMDPVGKKPVLKKKCMSYSKQELIDLAVDRGLSSSGTKLELCKRILEIYDEPKRKSNSPEKRTKRNSPEKRTKPDPCKRILKLYDEPEIKLSSDPRKKSRELKKKKLLSKEIVKKSNYRTLLPLVTRKEVIEFAKRNGFADQIDKPTDEILENMWMVFNDDESGSEKKKADDPGSKIREKMDAIRAEIKNSAMSTALLDIKERELQKYERLLDKNERKSDEDMRDVEKKQLEKEIAIHNERKKKRLLTPQRARVLDETDINDIENRLSEITAPAIDPPTSAGEIRKSIFKELGLGF